MKKVIVRSVYGAFEYAMSHYYPFGQRDRLEQTDTYAVISIQDSHTGGFGVQFSENEFCKGVLTLLFDDIVTPVEGAVLFSEEHAEQIIGFILRTARKADTLLVHCYAGQSRSRAVGAFATEMLGGDAKAYFTDGAPNMHIYDTLDYVWVRRQLRAMTGGTDS